MKEPAPAYVIGQWVRGASFYGRERLLRETSTGPQKWQWVAGLRRIGKTSLLRQLEFLTESNLGKMPLFWDLQGADSSEELHLSLIDALLDAEELFEDRGIAVADVQGVDTVDSFRRLTTTLRGRGLDLFLLVDEADEIARLESTEPLLFGRTLEMLESLSGVRVCLASSLRLLDRSARDPGLATVLKRFPSRHYLGVLDPESSRALVRLDQLAVESRWRGRDREVDALVEYCGHHPMFVQLAAKLRLDSRDLEEALERLQAERALHHHLRTDYELLDPLERRALLCVGGYGGAAVATAVRTAARTGGASELDALGSDGASALARLEQLGLVARRTESDWKLRSELWRSWLSSEVGA